VKTECEREQDVIDALSSQRWPGRCAEDLCAHVAACTLCADLVDVAGALLHEQESAWVEAEVPPPGVVWWRSQLRAREEAARTAARPLAFIQGVAASVALWLAVSAFRALPAASIPDWHKWLAPLASLLDGFSLSMALPGSPLVLLGLGAWLLLAPAVIYFAISE
jgi:hypothetical protein